MRMARVMPPAEWELMRPKVDRINELKRERNAIILAHTYQSPAIYFGIADVQGDSLRLAVESSKAESDVIVMCGVRFMAESAKILNPDRTVLLPDLAAGCSMASSITGEDVRRLRALHPGVPVVSYVNTNADVKAETDICCTSSNAVQIVRSLGVNKVIFLPDPYLGKWVQTQLTEVEMILWDGPCEVHVLFTARDVRNLRAENPGIEVLVHPECAGEVISEADYTGSTSGMIKHIDRKRPERIALITECSMADNVIGTFPGIEVVRPCHLCPHMQRITLDKVIASLENLEHKIEIDPEIRIKAKRSLDRMMEVPIS